MKVVLPLDLTPIRIRVGPCSLTLRFWREGNQSHWEVCEMQAGKDTAQQDMIQVIDEPTTSR